MENINLFLLELTPEQFNTLLHALQIVGIIVPVIGIIVILQKEQSRAATYLMMSNSSCAILNCAYLILLETGSYEGLSSAYKMEYISVSLFFYFFILFIMEYQHMRFSHIFAIGWPIFELIEIPQMWMKDAVFAAQELEQTAKDTMESVKKFGELGERWMGDMRVSIDSNLGLYQINMEGGILYQIRVGILSAILLVLLIITICRFIKMENKTERHNLGHLIVAQSVLLLVLVFSFQTKNAYDIVPIASALVVCAMTLSVMVGEFFTVTDRGRDWVFEHIDNVFLIADDQYGYLDANTYAKELFPQLRHYHKNQILPGEVLHLFLSSDDEVVIGDRYYNRKVATLYQNEKRKKKVAGYSLILVDMTKQYQLVEEAEAANESKSAFLSNVSHEIRTPMNVIVGMTEMMLRSDLTEEQQGYLFNIKNSGEALLTIINDILDISKIESGRMELVEEEYAPMSMLNDLGMMFLTRIGEKPVELLFDIDPKLPNKLYGDGLRVRQVLINILNNAVKFTEEGFVKLQVSVVGQVGDQMELAVRVSDSGQGIKEEDLGKLFASFSQVDSRRNHSKEGTGLGLSICKQLVQMMGGTIGVESTYGEGSTFYFNIKQKVVSDEPAAFLPEEVLWTKEHQVGYVRASDALDFKAPDAKVLIVDDNKMNLKVVLGLLSPLDMQIETAENGKEALEKVQKTKYDLVFMDHMMPIMDGVEATKCIRELEDDFYRQLPIIALTADAMSGAKAEFLSAGMNDFVAKPIEMKVISSKLKQYLPSEKIIKMEVPSDIEDETEDLPEIAGLNVEDGVKYSGGRKMFVSLLGDFYKLIDSKSNKIEKCLADGMIRDFTIEVHALKNTARMIGATELSEMFLELEMLGNQGDRKALEEKTPGVLELYRSYKEILRPYGALDESQLVEVDVSVIKELLQTMADAMDGFDLDGVDKAMEELEGYRLPEACSDKMDELRALVADVAMEDVIRVCREMAALL